MATTVDRLKTLYCTHHTTQIKTGLYVFNRSDCWIAAQSYLFQTTCRYKYLPSDIHFTFVNFVLPSDVKHR